ncbi:MAG: hypothetical protein B6D54_02715, partial [Epsilonproteobacteria bacterium 4484_65]
NWAGYYVNLVPEDLRPPPPIPLIKADHGIPLKLIEDEEIANILPKVEGKTTVIRLEKMHIKSIKFVESL